MTCTVDYFRYAVNACRLTLAKIWGRNSEFLTSNRPGYPNSSGLTNIDVAGVTSLGDSQWLPEHVFENIFQAADTVTWIKGKHSLKLGIDFRRQQRNFFQLSSARGYFNFAGAYTMDLTTSNGGNGMADLLFGAPISNEQDFLAGLYPTRYWDLAEFFQDDFRVNQKLTINLGLRYEITSPANGRVGNFDLNKAVVNTSYGPGAVSHAGVRFDKSDWGPRVGFAWSVAKNTVVRSAFGMFYSAEANIFDDLGLNPPQLSFYAANFNDAALPSASQLISSGFPAALPPSSPHEHQRAGQDHWADTCHSSHSGVEPWRAAPVHAELGGSGRVRGNSLLRSLEPRGQRSEPGDADSRYQLLWT